MDKNLLTKRKIFRQFSDSSKFTPSPMARRHGLLLSAFQARSSSVYIKSSSFKTATDPTVISRIM